MSEELFIAASASSPLAEYDSISLKDISDFNFIALNKFSPLRILCDKYCLSAGFNPNIIFESSDIESILNLVSAGLGISFWCKCSMPSVDSSKIKLIDPDFVIIDSIQTMYSEEAASAPGSVTQVRETTAKLMHISKGRGISVMIVGHVTKDGNIAGPRVLEHMVDTVLYFEGDKTASYRILRAVKNRFGSTNEIDPDFHCRPKVFQLQEVHCRLQA